MIRHIAVFDLADDVTDEQVRAVVHGLRSLPEQIPSIRSYEVGTDVGTNDENADLAVTALFEDHAGFMEYVEHPAHRRVADQLLAPIRVGRTVIQIDSPA